RLGQRLVLLGQVERDFAEQGPFALLAARKRFLQAAGIAPLKPERRQTVPLRVVVMISPSQVVEYFLAVRFIDERPRLLAGAEGFPADVGQGPFLAVLVLVAAPLGDQVRFFLGGEVLQLLPKCGWQGGDPLPPLQLADGVEALARRRRRQNLLAVRWGQPPQPRRIGLQ